MMKIEIRIARQGFIVAVNRTVLQFGGSPADAAALCDSISDMQIVTGERLERLNLPDAEWAVGSAEEAIMIVRHLLDKTSKPGMNGCLHEST